MIFTTFTLSQLEKYKVLGWDIDETMIKNDHSDAFAEYIFEHPQQTHIIVTHRAGGWENDIQEDFEIWGHHHLLYSRFTSVHSVPAELWLAWKFDRNPLTIQKSTDDYNTWKGKICKQFGVEALIDDNIENCYPGCEIHGIDFYYSHGLMK